MDRADVEVAQRLLVDQGRIGEALGREMPLVGAEERRELGRLGRDLEDAGCEVGGRDARHAELPQRAPQGVAHAGLLGEGAEVPRRRRGQVEEQPGDQRRPEAVGHRVDPLLHQERRRHLEGQLERRREAQARPARALAREALAEGVAEGVAGDEDPLRTGPVLPAQLVELGNEGVHYGGYAGTGVVERPG